MASIEQEQGNGWRFGWKNPNGGKRARVRMGTMSKKQAEKVKGYIQDLVDALGSGTPTPVEAAEWLLRLPPETYAKLAEAGLVADRMPRTLKAFCDSVTERVKGILTQATMDTYASAIKQAVERFGADRDISTITVGDALDFNHWLRRPVKTLDKKTGKTVMAPKVNASTANKRCSTLRAIFNDAERHQLIAKNPWADKSVPKSSPPAPDERRVSVKHEDALRIMEELGHVEMRALFAFARWAGTRQTEPLFMRWEHVSFAADGKPGHVLIPCEKTKVKTGKAWRKCPLFPEVEAALIDLQEQAPAGEEYLFPHYRIKGKNATTSALKQAMTRAGVSWNDPWLNMRRTRATELAERYPAFACAEWMGHDSEIADKHYRRASEELFTTAAAFNTGTQPGAQMMAQEVGQNPGHGLPKMVQNSAKVMADAIRAVEEKTQRIPEEKQEKEKAPAFDASAFSVPGWARTTDLALRRRLL